MVNGRVSCGACHLDAEAGTFEDAAMRLRMSLKRARAPIGRVNDVQPTILRWLQS